MFKKVVNGLILSASLLAFSAAANAETTLKLASVAPTASPWGAWVKSVAEKIEKESGGELKIELLLDGSVGDEQTITRQAAKGRMDIAYVSNVGLTLMSDEMSLASVPFLFDNVDQATCVLHSKLEGIYGAAMDKAGLVPMAWMDVGHFALFSREAIKVPGDLKGKKLRTGPAPTEVAYSERLGGSVVPMGVADVVPSLQTGGIDAAWFATVAGIAFGLHKVAPHVMVPENARVVGTAAISKRVWNKLSEKERKILKSSFAEAGPKLTAMVLGAERALVGKLVAAGLPVFQPNAEEQAPWKAAADGLMDQLVSDMGGGAKAVSAGFDAAKAECKK